MRTPLILTLVLSQALLACQTTSQRMAAKRLTRAPAQVMIVDEELKVVPQDPSILGLPPGADTDNLVQDAAKGNWKDIQSTAKLRLKDNPGDKLAHTWLAIASLSLNQTSLARFHASLVLRENPRDPYALNVMGLITLKNATLIEDYRRALNQFQLAAEAQENLAAPRLNIAYLNLSLGKLESARFEFEKAVQRCDCNPARLGLALTFLKLERPLEAIKELETALNLDPEDPLGNYLMGLSVRRTEKDKQQSREWFEKVLASTEANPNLQEKAHAFLEEETQEP